MAGTRLLASQPGASALAHQSTAHPYEDSTSQGIIHSAKNQESWECRVVLTNATLTHDPGEAEEEHNAPNVQEASHLENDERVLTLLRR